MLDKYSLNAPKMPGKRPYHRAGRLSVPEIMTIMILFHNSGYRCLKHFYLNEVCVNLRHLFPQVVSYNRFVELEKEAVIPLTIFIKKALLGKCTGISFVDSTPLKGALMSVSDRVLLLKRAIIETVKDELKNIAQIEHSRHRSVCNFAANLLGALAAYCYFPKKPWIQVAKVLDNQLALF